MNPLQLMRIVRWCAVLLVGLLPVFFIPVIWVTVIQAKMILVSVLLLVGTLSWIAARMIEGAALWPRSPLAIAAIALSVVYAISALVAGIVPTSLVSGLGVIDTLASVVLLSGSLLLVSMAFENAYEASTTLLRAFLSGSLALMLLQVFHVLVPNVSLNVFSGGAASIFGSWHELGMVAAVLVFLAIALRTTIVAEGGWKWVLYAAGVLAIFMLFVVNMRDVWISLGVLLLAYGVYEWWTTRASLQIGRVLVPVVVGALSLGAALGTTAIYNSLPSMLQVPQIEVRPSLAGTFEIGKQSAQNAKSLVFGTGPNTFTQQWSLYKPVGVNQTEFWNVDFTAGFGFLPTTFITAGALGLLAWAVLFLALLYSLWRFLKGVGDTVLAGVYVAIFGAALYIAAFHILYVPDITLAVLLFVFLGLIAAARGMRAPTVISLRPQGAKAILHTSSYALAMLFLLLASLGVLRATISDVLVNRSAAVYAQTQDVSRSLSLVRTALVFYSNNDRAHRAAVELGLIKLSQLARETTDQSVATLQVTLQNTIEHGLAAVNINSGDYQNWLALAGLYQNLAGAGVQGAYENAMSAYSRAVQDNPLNPLPLLQVAQLDIALEKYDEALQLLNRAVELKPDYAAAFFLRSQIYALREMNGQALIDAQNAVRFAQEDPLSWYNLGSIQYSGSSYEDAAQSLERAISLRADYANALFLLGLSYEKLGRTDEALLALRKVAATNQGDKDLLELIANIEAGEDIGEGSAGQ